MDATEQLLPPGLALEEILGASETHLFLLLRHKVPIKLRFELWSYSTAPRQLEVLATDVRFGFNEFEPTGVSGDLLYFMKLDDSLWRTDGTQEGTVLLHDFNTAIHQLDFDSLNSVAIVENFSPVPEGVVFSGADFDHGVELWFSDGTPENTYELKNIMSENENSEFLPRNYVSSFPDGFNVQDDVVYFSARGLAGVQTPDGPELGIYRTDGTRDGTVRIPGSESSYVAQLEDRYILGADGHLWSSRLDGSDRRMLKAHGSPLYPSLTPVGIQRFNEKVLYLVYDESLPRLFQSTGRLWVSDGTTGGTNLLTDQSVGFEMIYTIDTWPAHLTLDNGYALLVGRTEAFGRELWITDGTASGTRLFMDMNEGPADGIKTYTQFFKVMDGAVYFPADAGELGSGLWTIDFKPPPGGHEHDLDVNKNYRLELAEILRLVQFFNSDGFHVQSGTEDGYAPGPGDTTGTPHDSDYLTEDWAIDLSELLRAIQLYNAPVCNYCTAEGTEDGFAV